MRVATPRYSNSQLRYQRQQRCWTQSQVADKLYALLDDTELTEHGVIDRNMVSKWEGGLHTPNNFWQGKLCELFATSPEQLGFIKQPETEQKVVKRPEAEQQVVEQPAIIAAEPSLPAAASVPAESEVVVPPSIWKQMRPLRLVTLDAAIWCAAEVNDIDALAADWRGQGLSIQHLQTQVHREIEG